MRFDIRASGISMMGNATVVVEEMIIVIEKVDLDDRNNLGQVTIILLVMMLIIMMIE